MNIWRVPKYLPYLQPELDEKIISEAELKIGYKFPEKYIELLKIQNGGYIRCTIKGTPHSQIYGIGPYYPSILNSEWLKEYEGLSFEIKGLFPFDGDGHWNICLDYRENKIEPKITYIDTESDYERTIANTFTEYLNQLEIESDEYVIDTEQDIEDIIELISDIANINFNDPDNFAHGYLEYTGKINDSWIWLSANKVQSGFVRSNDERYNELKSKMKGMALRYPEISENSLLINLSEDVERERLFKLMIQEGIELYELKNILENNPNR